MIFFLYFSTHIDLIKLIQIYIMSHSPSPQLHSLICWPCTFKTTVELPSILSSPAAVIVRSLPSVLSTMVWYFPAAAALSGRVAANAPPLVSVIVIPSTTGYGSAVRTAEILSVMTKPGPMLISPLTVPTPKI